MCADYGIHYRYTHFCVDGTRPFRETPSLIYRKLSCNEKMAQLVREQSDDLLAGWSSELEAVLYSPEVEEAISEVRIWQTRVRDNFHN